MKSYTAKIIFILLTFLGLIQCSRSVQSDAGELALLLSFVEYSASGGLDTSFGAGGYFTSNAGTAAGKDDLAADLTLDSTGRIILGGTANKDTAQDMALWRINDDGSADLTFNGLGYARHSGSDSSSKNRANAILNDGTDNYYAVGMGINGDQDMAVWRYDQNGALNTGFQSVGYISHNGAAGGSGQDSVTSAVFDNQGRLLICGFSTNIDGDKDIAVWRRKVDGSSDNSFNGNGVVTLDYAGNEAGQDDTCSRLAVDAQGRIYVAALSKKNLDSDQDGVLLRYLDDGTLDTTFKGTGSFLASDVLGPGTNDYFRALYIDDAGRILVFAELGQDSTGDGSKLVIYRFLENGELDSTFDTDGMLIRERLGGLSEGLNDVILDNYGRPLVVGSVKYSNTDSGMYMRRFTTDFDVDTSFGDNGVFYSKGPSGLSGAEGIKMLMDSFGRILVAGKYTVSGGTDLDMIVWRLN